MLVPLSSFLSLRAEDLLIFLCFLFLWCHGTQWWGIHVSVALLCIHPGGDKGTGGIPNGEGTGKLFPVAFHFLRKLGPASGHRRPGTVTFSLAFGLSIRDLFGLVVCVLLCCGSCLACWGWHWARHWWLCVLTHRPLSPGPQLQTCDIPLQEKKKSLKKCLGQAFSLWL